jgi:D-glycero-alpha-D-manno-heptose 1-phosphate guanylyltransferase
MDAVILVGGMGTRLKSVVSDLPKPMAPVNGKPFLEYVLEALAASGVVSKIVLCVGYKREIVSSHFGTAYESIPVLYSIEESPLGTGGAVVNALPQIQGDNFLLLNGDTIFKIDFPDLLFQHEKHEADITIATKLITKAARYGTVRKEGIRIVQFEEKQGREYGEINGGIYIVNKNVFKPKTLPQRFSFETDFLEKMVRDIYIQGIPFDRYFIDIGIPEDFERAQKEF